MKTLSFLKKKSASKGSKLAKMEALSSKQLTKVTGGAAGTRGGFAVAGFDSR